MKISILGTRGEIPLSLPYHSRHSGLLVDEQLLIDWGEKCFLDKYTKWVLISHFHPDHAYFVRHKEKISTDIPIYGPEKHPLLKEGITINKETKIGPYIVIPIPTYHSKYVRSQGYVIKRNGSSFLYTSDLVWIDKKYHNLIDRVDLVITEASFIRKGGMVRKDESSGLLFGHNGIPNLISLLKPFSDKILFTHFGSWFFENTRDAHKKLKELGKNQNIDVIIGYDGMEINI